MKKLFLLLVLSAAASVHAASFFVTQSGAGSANGTSLANAWSVSQFNSVTSTNPGDTVFFSGTITSTITPADNGASGNNIILDMSGATLGGTSDKVLLSNRSFLTILGGTITGNAGAAISCGSYGNSNQSHDIEIKNFTWNSGTESSTGSFFHGYYGYNILLENNHVENQANFYTTDSTKSHDIIIRNNYFSSSANTSSQTDAIFAGDMVNMTIEGNKLIVRAPGATSGRHNDVLQSYESGAALHTRPSNWIVRYNWIELAIAAGGSSGDTSWTQFEHFAAADPALRIYGNVFIGSTNTFWNGNNGLTAYNHLAGAVFYVYNNTLIRKNNGPDLTYRWENGGTLWSKNNAGMSDPAQSGTFLQLNSTEGGGASGWSNNFWYQFDDADANEAGPGGSTTTNPNFTDFAGNSFSTQSGSALRNGGNSSIGSEYNQGIAFSATWPNPTLVTRTAGNWDVGAYQFSGVDTVAPALNSTVIPAAGASIILSFNEPVKFGAGGTSGWTFILSGGTVTLGTPTGSGSATITFPITNRTVNFGETGTRAYTQPGNGFEDDPAGNDLANIVSAALTNNSTQGQVETPVISLASGAYFGTQTTGITCGTVGASIYYTLDGTTPDATDTLYTNAISFPASATVTAIAIKSGSVDSPIASASYEINAWTTTSGIWKTFLIPIQAASFPWSFDIVASPSGSDVIIGLGSNAISAPAGMGPIIALSPGGTIMARDNTGYDADNTLSWTGGTTYRVSATVDPVTRTYSVTVTPSGGSQTVIATGYLFRNDQAAPTDHLDYVGILSLGGTATVTNMSISDDLTPDRNIECETLNVTTLSIGQ